MIRQNGGDFTRMTLYPFATTEREAAVSPRMDVTLNGEVRFDGRSWTRQEAMEYMAQLSAGFVEAFRIAEQA